MTKENRSKRAQDIRDQILAADDTKPRKESIEEWGLDVWLHPLDGSERFALTQIVENAKPGENSYILEMYVILSARTEDGERIFTEDDAPELAKKNQQVIARLSDLVLEISGMGDKQEAAVEGN